GSIAIQLARQLTPLTVLATASRPETKAWVQQLGAHHVIDHAKPIARQVKALDIGSPGFVFSTTNTDAHFAEIAELIAPQGRFGLIDDPQPPNIGLLKGKSISLHWESMLSSEWIESSGMASDARYGRPSGDVLTASQNSRNLSTRFSGGLPAIRAE